MHVAIIMHGNGQWALQRGLSLTAAGTAGDAALHTAVALAACAQVRTLTLYSICNSGGARPSAEVDADLCVLSHFLRGWLQRGEEESVRISLIGNTSRLNELLPPRCDHDSHLSVAGTRMHLRIVIDYSAHDGLIRTAWRSGEPHAPEEFLRRLRQIDPTALPAGPVDLLVRTGEGWCPSDFMLWEVAYAKLHFVDRLWPDFTARDFQQALTLHTMHNELVSTG
jgi:undecaprenyl diphosphate synthase